MYPRARRFFFLAVGAALMIPLAYLGIREARTPILYAEDELESRDCRHCAGTGRDEGLREGAPHLGGRCPFCRGDGKVDVIIPGPNHPVRLRGAVADLAKLEPFASYHSLRPTPFGRGKPPSTVGRARLRFTPERGEPLDVEANPYGLFHTRLPPGSYKLRVSAEGFAPLEAELEVKALAAPIWLEEAILHGDPHELAPGEARSRNGLEALIGLSRPGLEAAGFLQVRTAASMPF
jgi:hypothetical protein